MGKLDDKRLLTLELAISGSNSVCKQYFVKHAVILLLHTYIVP